MFGEYLFVSMLSNWSWGVAGLLLGFLLGVVVGRNGAAQAPKAALKARPQARGERGGRQPPQQQPQGGGSRERQREGSGGGTGRGVELYVGNLPYETTDVELGRAFERFGRVLSVRMIENRRNGKPKGFGFVEMADDASADAAIKAMNGADFKGRSIVVNEAKSRMRDDE